MHMMYLSIIYHIFNTIFNCKQLVAAAIKGLKIGKAAGPAGVVGEMMKAAGGFGSRWMTDLINNIVKEGYIPDDWRKSILVQGER